MDEKFYYDEKESIQRVNDAYKIVAYFSYPIKSLNLINLTVFQNVFQKKSNAMNRVSEISPKLYDREDCDLIEGISFFMDFNSPWCSFYRYVGFSTLF